jgi:hypothetical protein
MLKNQSYCNIVTINSWIVTLHSGQGFLKNGNKNSL